MEFIQVLRTSQANWASILWCWAVFSLLAAFCLSLVADCCLVVVGGSLLLFARVCCCWLVFVSLDLHLSPYVFICIMGQEGFYHDASCDPTSPCSESLHWWSLAAVGYQLLAWVMRTPCSHWVLLLLIRRHVFAIRWLLMQELSHFSGLNLLCETLDFKILATLISGRCWVPGRDLFS